MDSISDTATASGTFAFDISHTSSRSTSLGEFPMTVIVDASMYYIIEIQLNDVLTSQV